jgi:hypothetical protein
MKLLEALLICFLCIVTVEAYAGPVGTAFTYQGQLTASGAPANGNYDFTYNLYNTNLSGTPLTSPILSLGVGVTNGLFDASLDFGSQFNGEATWLEISVRSNNVGNFVVLAPRQQVTPTPNALFASTASNLSGSIPTTQLSGTLVISQLPTAVLTNNASSVNLSGTFSGNGAGLYNTITTGNYVFAYDATSQTVATANTFQNVTFGAASLGGWTYSAGSFTCNQNGTYLIQYSAEVGTTANSATTVSLHIVDNGIEFVGSQSSVTVAVANQPTAISRSILITPNSGDVLQIQFTGSSTSAELVSGNGAGTTKPSIAATIIRIQ